VSEANHDLSGVEQVRFKLWYLYIRKYLFLEQRPGNGFAKSVIFAAGVGQGHGVIK